MIDEEKTENKHWLSQIELGEWYSNAQYYYRPRNEKERNLMHGCYEEGYNNGFSNGLTEGKPKWHDLREDPNDLPKCTENEQIIFYVHEYYKGIEKYINHYCLGFYKKSFMDDDVKLFVERSKGYECEHSTEDVLCWCKLPQFKE